MGTNEMRMAKVRFAMRIYQGASSAPGYFKNPGSMFSDCDAIHQREHHA